VIITKKNKIIYLWHRKINTSILNKLIINKLNHLEQQPDLAGVSALVSGFTKLCIDKSGSSSIFYLWYIFSINYSKTGFTTPTFADISRKVKPFSFANYSASSLLTYLAFSSFSTKSYLLPTNIITISGSAYNFKSSIHLEQLSNDLLLDISYTNNAPAAFL
jgi:hypothetical protein